MRRTAGWIAMAFVTAGLGARGLLAEGLGLTGKFEIEAIVVEYAPHGDRLRLQATLTTRMVIDYEASDRADIASLLQMVDTFSSPGSARMFVVIESDVVTAFQLAAGRAR